MKDALSVTTEATRGLSDKLAEFWEISTARVSELLGKDNPYPKMRRIVRAISAVSSGRDRIRRLLIIKVDFNAFIDGLIGDSQFEEVEACELCDELYDVIKTRMVYMPVPERLKELREAAAVIKREINSLTKESEK